MQAAMKMLNNTLCFDSYSTESIVSYLVSVNAKLLIPWLLADERPVDLCKIWPTDCSLSTMQVTAKLSFVYSIPRGVFVMSLSSTLHLHSSLEVWPSHTIWLCQNACSCR